MMRLGIHFGTTSTTAAVWTRNQLRIVRNPLDDRHEFPSSAFADSKGEVIVGTAAEAMRLAEPESYAGQFRRELLEPAFGEEDRWVMVGQTPVEAKQLVALLLKLVHEEALALSGGRPCTHLALTAPVGAGDSYQELLRRAAEAAGLASAESEIVLEPVAAAWERWADDPAPFRKPLLVYDLADDHFAAAVVHPEAGVVAADALDYCGESDLNAFLTQDLLQQAPQSRDWLACESHEGRLFQMNFLRELDAVKQALTKLPQVEFTVMTPLGSPLIYRQTRERFETLVHQLADPTIEVCRHLCDVAVDLGAVPTEILLVGRGSRIPAIERILADALSVKVRRAAEPETVTSRGAIRWLNAQRSSLTSPSPRYRVASNPFHAFGG